MKNRLIILGLISFLGLGNALAQVENDDMYFNSKDRAKLRAARVQENAYASNDEDTSEDANPTDSYSARNINPEYTSRANSKFSNADNEDYYVYDYHYAQQNQFNNFNNNYNNWYRNDLYSANYWGPSINGWNSPYYGSYYDRWGNPWANPYYRSGWSSSFSYFWGNSYNYGWGMNLGYGNPFYNSWGYNNMWGYGYNPYSPYFGAYSPFYGGYYPGNVVVVENNYRAPVYGKRNSRSAQLNREYNNRGRTRMTGDNNDNTTTINNGRVRTSSDQNRRWWSQPQNSNSGMQSQPSNNRRSSWESNTRSSWPNNNSGGFERSSMPSHSSGTSGGSFGGGSGSRSSRGRN